MIAVVGSALYGTPAKLPGVALGLPLLLDLERAAAVLAVTAGVLIFALLTSRGHLPTQFGNVAYPAVGRQEELTRRVAELDQRLERRPVPLEEGSRTNNEALPLITSELTELSARCLMPSRAHEGARAKTMATKPSPLEQLKTLVDERASSAIDWRDSLPTLRAQASATSAVLSDSLRPRRPTPRLSVSTSTSCSPRLAGIGRKTLRVGSVKRFLSHESNLAFRANACRMLRLLDTRFAARCRYRESLTGRRSQRCALRSRRWTISKSTTASRSIS